jgi:hypothetical protein
MMWTKSTGISVSIVATAVACYLAVAGCSEWPAASRADATQTGAAEPGDVAAVTTTRPALNGMPFRGVGMQIQRVDWLDRYKQSIDEIAALGADTVKFVVDARQEHGGSSRIYLDLRMTPSAEALADMIRYAKSKNLRVILMPIVLLDAPRGNEWRGQINPDNWDAWWESYRNLLVHFSWIAQGNGADVLVVGSELVSTEKQTDQWITTIRTVRQNFKGLLTYSANWDHYSGIGFWNELDMIGMNSYWKLGPDNAVSVDEIVENWRPIREEVLGFARSKGKPLLFLEVGWCSMSNAAHEPWDYTTGDDVDNDLQKRLYEGFFRAWHGEPGLGGFSMWEWTPGEGGAEPQNERSYTPENKPAEAVLRDAFARPGWTVGLE